MSDPDANETLPEGACITAEIPDTTVPRLGSIVTNPYGLAPLTAVIRDGGQTISEARVRVVGKGGNGVDIDYQVSNSALWTHGGIPIFGLYPDHSNKVEVSYTLKNERIRERYTIYAPPVRLPITAGQTGSSLARIEPVKVDSQLKRRLYLYNHLLSTVPGQNRLFKWNTPQGGAAEWDAVGINWIADSQGDVRWYMDIERIHNSTTIDGTGATMGFQQTSDGKLIFGQGQRYYKYDLLGRPVWQRTLPAKFADFSHEIRETSKGTYLLRAGSSDYRRTDDKQVRTVRDQIIELNSDGDVVDFWDLGTILDPHRDSIIQTIGKATLLPEGAKTDSLAENERLDGELSPFGDTPGVGIGRNWAHVNAISHDPKDDGIIVSARHQGVVKIGRDKEVKWILAHPRGWKSALVDKVLTPVDGEGRPLERKEDGSYAGDSGFDWPWTQHTAWLTSKGTLTVFDNGWGRAFAPTKLVGNYSRAVEYLIDEDKRTVQQLWEFGKERGDDWYSPITSVVEYREDTDTQMVYSASVAFLTRERLVRPVLTEVKYGTQEVLAEYHLFSQQPGNVGYRALIIDLERAF